jgi:hypothetical protein
MGPHHRRDRKMKKGIVVFAMALGITWCVMGCERGSMNARDGGTQLSSVEGIEEAFSSSSFVEREFWLALAEEPGWHLTAAHEEFLAGRSRRAAEELEKVAAMLNFETRHCHSINERGLLLASVSELREVARGFLHEHYPPGGGPSIEVLDRVSALAFRTIAAHQVTLGRDALVAGDARMAGRYILETINALEAGFDRGGIPLGNALSADLRGAQEVGARLEIEGEGSREEGKTTLDDLDAAVTGLGNVLTSRRK